MFPNRTMLFVAGAVVLSGVSGYLAGYSRGRIHSATAPSGNANVVASLLHGAGDESRPPQNMAATFLSPSDSGRLPNDPEARIGRFGACMIRGDAEERNAEFITLVAQMTPADAPAIRDLFRKLDRMGLHRDFEWHAFWSRWGKIDGAAAIDCLVQGNPDDTRSMEIVMRGWGATQPDTAIKWLQEHEEVRHFGTMFAGFVSGYAKADLDKATAFATASVPAGEGHLWHVMEVLADRALEDRHLDGMLSWFDRLPDEGPGSAKWMATDHVLYRVLTAGPDKAMEWVKTMAAQPWRNDRMIGEVAERAAESSPETAMLWLTSLPPSQEGTYPGMGRVTRRWAEQEPAGFKTWLQQEKPQPIQDQALAAYSRYLAPTSPMESQYWASKVKDPRWLQQK